MTCPFCKELMCDCEEFFSCPSCRGEFFTSEQAPQEEIDIDWFISRLLYPAAMRNEKEARRHDYRHGFLRSAGRQWEDWESNLYVR